ncbi:unnamed protein product [Didymodactylos carnosus]|uniref:Uncharacterized protein n=1 Tax=Didymodactylos carnosus TaxID=1234261 RepID=A0A815ZJ60_9BILA|nr:unnamed protein product [Didymodactylos carnosus]CAF4451885.1 unnamed protein product [Didymodactylos carnosus]
MSVCSEKIIMMQWNFIYLFLCYYLMFVIVNITNSLTINEYSIDYERTLLCYSCHGEDCKSVTSDSSQTLCNIDRQLCWAGYINNQFHRTCSSRYCTPSDISLDDDVRIETCLPTRDNIMPFLKIKPTKTISAIITTTSISKTTSSNKSSTNVTKSSPSSFIDDFVEDEELNDSEIFQNTRDKNWNVSDPSTFDISWKRTSYDDSSATTNYRQSINFIIIVICSLFTMVVL